MTSQVTDYTARFSYGYLMEIKVWATCQVCVYSIFALQSRVDSAVYEELLKVLLDAERNKLTPSEVIILTPCVYNAMIVFVRSILKYLKCLLHGHSY